jgi:hypothetical protein
MNEITFVLAVLVNKEVITKQEAQKLHKSMTQNILNSNINEMISKVERALSVNEISLQTIDANDIIK